DRRGATGGGAQQLADLAAREPDQIDRLEARLLSQQPERAAHAMAALARLLEQREQQQDRDAQQLEGEVLEQTQRARVGPLQVLDQDQDRTATGTGPLGASRG